mgnify:CR=1 FL=1
MTKIIVYGIISLAIFSVFLTLSWIDPILIPQFHKLPQPGRLLIYSVLGVVFGVLMLNFIFSIFTYLERRKQWLKD